MTVTGAVAADGSSSPLRILFTPPRYAPYVGGVEEHCRGYARELRRRGHSVTVCCADEGVPLARVDGIPVRRCRTALKVANTNVTPGLPLYLAMAKADIIHTFLPTPWSADWSAMMGKRRRIPVVLSYDNDIVGQGMAARIAGLYNSVLLPRALRAADQILLLNPWKSQVPPHLSPYTAKIRVVPPGIDTDRFTPDGGGRWTATFFFLSLLDEYHRYKGLDVLLRAMAFMVKEVPEARLIVGGRGPLRTEFMDLARRLDLGNSVEFRGYIPDADLITYYRRCTAFVLPSTSALQEGFGIVAAEAMACNAPVVVSEIVGIAPLIANQSLGHVVPASDVRSLAAALIHRVRSPQARDDATGAKLVARELSLSAVGTRLEALYRALIASRASYPTGEPR
jgi:glycosyltransferase involved in cell wall biosynthesis